MADITVLPEKEKTYLARLRRYARARGFRILHDWTGGYSLVDARIAPQRELSGLTHVSLTEIGIALTTPLPPPKPKRVRRAMPMARLGSIEVADKAGHASGNGSAS